MSIASELTALANNRDAIKAAIEAKGVADAGDTLAEFPAAIASIPSGGGGAPETEPYPWVGSGTHAWLHYDSNSRSHVCQVNFTYYGDVTLDWGDGSATVSLTGSSSATTTTQSHTYADGDFRLDITGETPLEFGHWDASSSSYKNVNTSGFISDDTPFNQTGMNLVPIYRDALIQFETDSPSFIGGYYGSQATIGGTSNMRWLKFTRATEVGRNPTGFMYAIKGIFAPLATRIFLWGSTNANGDIGVYFSVAEFPSVQSFYPRDNNKNNAISLFWGATALREFSIPYGITAIPDRFMDTASAIKEIDIPFSVTSIGVNVMTRGQSLRRIRFLPNPSEPSATRSITIEQNFLYRANCLEELSLPEGLSVINGESCAFLWSVRKVELPSTLTSATNSYTFAQTYNLEVLVCRAQTPPAISSNTFTSHAPNAKYYIPYGTTAAYTAATNWSQFSSLFVELNPDGTIPTT